MLMINQKQVWLTTVFCLLSVVMLPAPTAHASDAVPASDWTTVGPGDMDTDSVMVTMIQYLLRAHGYPVKADGEFGTQTQRQIRAFQRHQGLRVTGTVNGRTWLKLIILLHRGSKGDAVRAAQACLQQYDLKLPIDGVFGLRTEKAVWVLQRTDGLRVDGIVGPVTWWHLTDPVPD